MAGAYELDESEVSFVTGSGKSTNKVESIVEDAEERREKQTVEHSGSAFFNTGDSSTDTDSNEPTESNEETASEPDANGESDGQETLATAGDSDDSGSESGVEESAAEADEDDDQSSYVASLRILVRIGSVGCACVRIGSVGCACVRIGSAGCACVRIGSVSFACVRITRARAFLIHLAPGGESNATNARDNAQPDQHQADAVHEHHAPHVAPVSPQRHADSDLVRALLHRVGQYAIDADGSQK